jgi:hypothetical protein
MLRDSRLSRHGDNRQDRKASVTAGRLSVTLASITVGTWPRKRDRTMLVLGFAAELRQSELFALMVDDLEEVPEGVGLTIRRSKTDQQGEGRVIAIPAG